MPSEIVTAIFGLTGTMIGGAVTFLTTWVIARGELTKRKKERIWELRRDAYTKIIGSMTQATRLIEHINENYQSDPHGYDSSDDVKQASTEFSDSFKDARAVFTSNTLLLSSLFSEKFETIHNNVSNVEEDPNLTPPETTDKIWLAMSSGCRELLEIAKAEIVAD